MPANVRHRWVARGIGRPLAISTSKRGVAALRHRGPDGQATAVISGRSCDLHARSHPAGHHRPLPEAARSQCAPTTDASRSSSTGRSTTSVRSARSWRPQVTGSDRVPTPKCCSAALVAWGPVGLHAASRDVRLRALRPAGGDAPPRQGPARHQATLRSPDEERLVAFASEVRALVAAKAVEPRLDPEAVAGLLATGSVPEPRTILEGVEMLSPGSWLRAGRSRRGAGYLLGAP